MKRSFFLVLLAMTGAVSIRAQSIGPSTLNASGGTAVVGGSVFDWSVGEMTMVSTFTSANIIVTQGVMQPYDGPTKVADNHLLKDQLKVFPNPATSIVNLEFTSAAAGTLTYRLMDITGRVIKTVTIDVQQGTTTEQINVTALACATYMLDVSVNTGNDMTERASYKIQKLK